MVLRLLDGNLESVTSPMGNEARRSADSRQTGERLLGAPRRGRSEGTASLFLITDNQSSFHRYNNGFGKHVATESSRRVDKSCLLSRGLLRRKRADGVVIVADLCVVRTV
ncbi:unnamed protein product [Colias eurytheme]|nr:unnamed protein product [Colias eurytheme]